MRLHRFYLADTGSKIHAGQEISIDLSNERLIHQWRDIFRFGTGDRVLIFNETMGEWLAEFKSLDKKNGAVLEIVEQDRVSDKALPLKNIALYMAIIKNSNFDLVVEKATELGISRIVPITTERTVKSGLNFDRLNKLTIEAAEQSGRIGIPSITEIMDIEQSIKNAKEGYEQVYFGHISDKNKDEISVSNDVALFIGPEGGWSDPEIALFEKEEITPLALGQFVLRAETAAIVGVSKLS